jgi:hypothetical protein
VQGGDFSSGDGGAMQEMFCSDCGEGWTDIYKLTNVVE